MSYPEPACDQSAPFLMRVESVHLVRKGSVVVGYVERGRLKINEQIEVIGLGPTRPTAATDFEQYHRHQDEIYCGDTASILLLGLDKFLQCGQIIASPHSIRSENQFTADFRLVHDAEDENIRAIAANVEAEFLFWSVLVPGTYIISQETKMAAYSDNVTLTCTLRYPIAMEAGLEFAVCIGGKVVGTGKVVELITKL